MASDNELVENVEEVADASQSCMKSGELDSQPMSGQTHIRQDQLPLPAKPNASHNNDVSDCQSRISSCSINPQNTLAAPSLTQGGAGVFKKIVCKHEEGLLVLLPTLIQWLRFCTLITLTKDLRASEIGVFKIIVLKGVSGNLLP